MEDLKCAYEIAREEQIRRNKSVPQVSQPVNPIEKKASPTPTKESRKRKLLDKNDEGDSKKEEGKPLGS